VYRDKTHFSHEGTILIIKMWQTIGVLKPDSSSHASIQQLRRGRRLVYRDTTHISHVGTNVNERWPTIGVLRHDSFSHASSNCDVADDWCIETRLIQSHIHLQKDHQKNRATKVGLQYIVRRRCRWKSDILSRATWCISRCGVNSSGVWEATMMIILI
jgi:hypothetical protein